MIAASRIKLHPMVMREEDERWIVGRQETGKFVEIPGEGVTFLRALQDGQTIAGAEEWVLVTHQERVDGLEFARTLVELEFVSSIDEEHCETASEPPSLRWLQPDHVSWLFSWPVYACVLAFVAANFITAFLHGDLVPSYHAFFVTNWQGFNIAWNTGIFIIAVGAHEAAHLAAARAAKVYARISLGTRLFMLCAQTTVSGLWGAPRRVRFRVYLAGMTMDLLIISSCLFALQVGHLTGFPMRSLQALILGLMLSIAQQFALYTRTDVYLVLQEALHCKNLYADAWQYVAYNGRRFRATGVGGRRPGNPTLEIPKKERRPVRIYSVVMLLGTAVSLALFAFYGIPIFITLVLRSVAEIVRGAQTAQPLKVADGATALIVEGTLQALFIMKFLATHGTKMTGALRVGWRRSWRFMSRNLFPEARRERPCCA